jgi:hypothetical protein
MIIQTVQMFATNPPPAPYVVRAADGGWHFDCGNCVGWSGPFPKPCRCGHCLPTYEAVRRKARRLFGQTGGSILAAVREKGDYAGGSGAPIGPLPPVPNKTGGPA